LLNEIILEHVHSNNVGMRRNAQFKKPSMAKINIILFIKRLNKTIKIKIKGDIHIKYKSA